ncbi:hypothetical protein [Candidatus Magnetaquicoccus inordinatus]|uniref:hypothetical protein n=1 Tax=Candidatus Magnetaquicoccus inordinatus TaxID=2496818 RepID=UPI00129116C8|nr:hypothetical protein [Candidatus Magnetaquicoccus inordinatus]
MRDLYVMTADADAEAVLRRVLQRHQSLGIRKVDVEVERYVGRDAGVVKEGPALLKLRKGQFAKVMLIWDHHGSGKEQEPAAQVQQHISAKMENESWSGHYLAQVLVPELEEWLWHNPEAIGKHLQVDEPLLQEWQQQFAAKKEMEVVDCRKRYPKELFFYCLQRKRNHNPRPEDYRKIAGIASLRAWQKSESFKRIVILLKEWFPDANVK